MSQINSDLIGFVCGATTIVCLLIGLIVSLGYFYRKRELVYLETVKTISLNHEKAILTTQVEIQEQTFLNIAREIHDNINLSLSLAKLNLNTVDLNDPQRLKTT